MSSTENRQPNGVLKISQDVIATIAKVSTMEITGVDSLATPTGQINHLFSKGAAKKPIEVTISDDFVMIDISINLMLGAKITEVCSAIQASVKENVQTMTGMAVSKVNVFVQGITILPKPVMENTVTQ